MSEAEFRAWVYERLIGSLILRRNFDPHILSNSIKLWMSMKRALLDIHFMMSLGELTHLKTS